MNTINIYEYKEYKSSDNYIGDFIKYIKILHSINRVYSYNLVKSIKLIDFTKCSKTLDNFNNNNHDSINISMNIYDLLMYILKHKEALYTQTINTHVYTNVISDLNKYSLLLNYICCILYIQNTPDSLTYFIELLEYGQIFDTISKVISKEISNFTFYRKLVVQNSYTFTDNIRDEINLHTIIREINNKLYNLLFELDETKKDTLINTYIDKICDILVKREDQIYLIRQISTDAELSEIILAIIDKFQSYLNISLNIIKLNCNVRILYRYYIDILNETIEYLKSDKNNTQDELNKLNKLYTFFDKYKLELNNLLYILYLENKFDIIYNMIEYSDIFKTISEYLYNKIHNQEIGKTYTFKIKPVNYTVISNIDEDKLIAHMKKYNLLLYNHIMKYETSENIKNKFINIKDEFKNRLCEFIKSISPAPPPAVSVVSAAPPAVVSPAVIAPATVVSAPAVVVSAPAAAVSTAVSAPAVSPAVVSAAIAPAVSVVSAAPPAVVSEITPEVVSNKIMNIYLQFIDTDKLNIVIYEVNFNNNKEIINNLLSVLDKYKNCCLDINLKSFYKDKIISFITNYINIFDFALTIIDQNNNTFNTFIKSLKTIYQQNETIFQLLNTLFLKENNVHCVKYGIIIYELLQLIYMNIDNI